MLAGALDTSPVKAGFPRDSTISPLFFLVYINDQPNGLTSNVKLFSDDSLNFLTSQKL